MELKKIVLVGLASISSICSAIFYKPVPVTILLEKTDENFRIAFKAASRQTYPIFSIRRKPKKGTYSLVSEQFIKNNDIFEFDSKQINALNGYISTIEGLTDNAFEGKQSYFSWTTEKQFILNEKKRLTDAVNGLYKYLKENIFDHIKNNINQFAHPKNISSSFVDDKGELVSFTIDQYPFALTLDLYGENLINKPWRDVYWHIQAFCKELGISLPPIVTWGSWLSTGLKVTALVAGLGYLAKLEYQAPGTISGTVSSFGKQISSFGEKITPQSVRLEQTWRELESTPYTPAPPAPTTQTPSINIEPTAESGAGIPPATPSSSSEPAPTNIGSINQPPIVESTSVSIEPVATPVPPQITTTNPLPDHPWNIEE